MAAARATNPALGELHVVLPSVTFRKGNATLQLGKRSLRLVHLPGHSPDGIGVLLEEDRILFAGDAVMPLPHVRDGDVDWMRQTLKTISGMGLENIVQGHGEVILRGEIDEMITSHLTYLDRIEREVRGALRRGWTREELQQITIEQCGKSRILLNGLASELHLQNLNALYDRYLREGPSVATPGARIPARTVSAARAEGRKSARVESRQPTVVSRTHRSLHASPGTAGKKRPPGRLGGARAKPASRRKGSRKAKRTKK